MAVSVTLPNDPDVEILAMDLVATTPTPDVWTGPGTTNNWSDPGNWSLNAVPGPTTAVQFDNTSQKDAIVDPGFAGTVASVYVTSQHTGNITLGRSLDITGSFTQGGGTYDANGFATVIGGTTTLYIGTYKASTAPQTFAGGLYVQGGTFSGSTGAVTASQVTIGSGTMNAPSGTLGITGAGFNANGGTVVFDGSGTQTINSGNASFNNLTIASGSTLSLQSNVIVVGTFQDLGTLDANGFQILK